MTFDPQHDPALDTTVAPTPVATAPVGAPPAASAGTQAQASARPRPNRVRWFAALGIVALVVGVSAFAAVSLTGSSPAATVTGYVPTDSVMYGELRLDLPGDQKQQVGAFLSKFPGFADTAALDTKLDEVLDRLVSEGSDGKQTFTADIKPWFDGELAFAAGPLPNADALDSPESAAAAGRGLLLISIKDEALARAWFTTLMTEKGATGTPQTYEGVELTVFTDPQMGGAQAAVAFIGGDVAVVGDLDSVKAAVDTKGASGLAATPGFSAAMGATEADHIGFVYVDIKRVLDSALAMTESAASAPPVSDAMLALVPDWSAFSLRVESDALVMDSTTPHVAAAPGPDGNAPNGVADWAPPSTIVLAAGNDAGPTILEAVAHYRTDPAIGEAIKGIDQAAGMIGGLDAAIGWMGDTGLVIATAGDSVEGGLVSVPADAAAGRQLLTTLRSFAALGGAQQGVQVRDEDYNGTTITILDLGSLQGLAGLAGAASGGALPPEATSSLPDGNVELAYAATDGVVVIGSGPAFVKSVLDAGAGASLADDARFQGLVGRVGAEHTGLAFLDIAAIRGHVEGLLSQATAAQRAEYEESIKPFLTPFDAFVAASVTGNELDEQHAVITVK